jgi:phage FluMu protein Com
MSGLFVFIAMYEIRCLKCNRKLGELARKPFKELTYTYKCKHCGRLIQGEIFLNRKQGKIFASLFCSCGFRKTKLIGHLVYIKCKRCKKVNYF